MECVSLLDALGRLAVVTGIDVPVVVKRVSEFGGLVAITAFDPASFEVYDVIVDPLVDVVRYV